MAEVAFPLLQSFHLPHIKLSWEVLTLLMASLYFGPDPLPWNHSLVLPPGPWVEWEEALQDPQLLWSFYPLPLLFVVSFLQFSGDFFVWLCSSLSLPIFGKVSSINKTVASSTHFIWWLFGLNILPGKSFWSNSPMEHAQNQEENLHRLSEWFCVTKHKVSFFRWFIARYDIMWNVFNQKLKVNSAN